MSSLWNKITSIFTPTPQPCKDAKDKEKARNAAEMKAIEEGPICKPSSTTSNIDTNQTGMNGEANGQANGKTNGEANGEANRVVGGRKKSKKSRRNKKKKTKRIR